MKHLNVSIPKNMNQWVSIAGLGIVVLSTLHIAPFWPSWAIPVIGAFIGFSVVSDPKNFLLAGLALLGAKWGLGHLPMFGPLLQDFTQNLIGLVAPAMLVVSIRAIYKEIKP